MLGSAIHRTSTQHRVQSGPLSSLPPELLLEIFQHACEPSTPLNSPPLVIGRHQGPFWLGKVCSLWRSIAWAAPSLWAYVHLVPTRDKFGVQAELLDDYLGRSKDLPLAILFTKRNDDPMEYWGNFSLPIYALIARECHRWEAVDIFIPYLCAPHMNACCVHLPLLRSASFEALQPGSPLHFVENASQLSELALIIFTFPRMETPLRHLTHFSGSKINSGEVLHVLNFAPNLRSCLITYMKSQWPGTFPDPTYVHVNNLEVLTIQYSLTMGAQASLLLHILSAPALREFKCSTLPGEYLPLDLIEDLIERGQCGLEILELETTNLKRSTTDLDNLLKRATNLSKLVLKLDDIKMDKGFLDDIAMILDPLSPTAPLVVDELGLSDFPITLPNLQHLEVRFRKMDSLLPILTALKHRWLYGAATTSQAYGRNFLRISFATLPEWCRSEAIRVLGNEIREGLVVAFIES